MSLSRNGMNSVPDGPPLACIARNGAELHVTILHAAAADLLWQLREPLTALYGSTSLRLTMLEPSRQPGNALEIQWKRPTEPKSRISARLG